MPLTLRFWGTRGSIPSPGAATVRYGGNTACVEVRSASGALLILDAGTGIRALGRALVEQAAGAAISGDIFLSHAHWDHVQGLPFFAPIYTAGNHFRIWSAPVLARRVGSVLREQMSETVFPVRFDDVAASVELRALDGAFTGPDFTVEALEVRHPGGALGYRVRERGVHGGGIVYISDNELGDAAAGPESAESRAAIVEFARGAAVLIHDATFTDDEYEQFRGWGHSRWTDVLDLAADAGVQRLILFHHSPDRGDDEIDRMLGAYRSGLTPARASLVVAAAAEGMEITV